MAGWTLWIRSGPDFRPSLPEPFSLRSNTQILLPSDHQRRVGISGICLVAEAEQEEGRVAASTRR